MDHDLSSGLAGDTDPSCAFCRVAAGADDAHVVWADEHVVAFLDRAPLFKGHVLVVPRRHRVVLDDLDDDEVAVLFGRVRRVVAAVPVALDAHGTFVAVNNVVSQSVAHVHVHVVPRRRKDGLRGFFWPRQRYAEGEAAAFAARLRDALVGPGT